MRLIVTQDSRALARRLTGVPANNVADNYFDGVIRLLRSCISDVVAINENEVENGLLARVEGRKVLCVDRYLCPEADFLRLEVNRKVGGELIPRIGANSFSSQMTKLKVFLDDHEVVVIDDGVVSGGTLRKVLGLCGEFRLNVSRCLVYLARPDFVFDHGQLDVVRSEQFDDWVNLRDLGMLGGMVNYASVVGGAAYPYFRPFSDGAWASLQKLDRFDYLSRGLRRLFVDFITALDAMMVGGITMNSVCSSGLPTPIGAALGEFDLNDRLLDYLGRLDEPIVSKVGCAF